MPPKKGDARDAWPTSSDRRSARRLGQVLPRIPPQRHRKGVHPAVRRRDPVDRCRGARLVSSRRRPRGNTRHSDRVLAPPGRHDGDRMIEPSSPPAPAQAAPGASGTAPPGPRLPTARPPASAPRPVSLPNARKGYKLTLWVSATTETGQADVHGLLQLDGADPIPFCHLKDVQNPLVRALQEAFLAVERVRARPPRMSAPPATPATPTRPRAPMPPVPSAPPTAAPATTPAPPATPPTPAASVPARKRAPVDQPSLF
jgi:hypothetical protein